MSFGVDQVMLLNISSICAALIYHSVDKGPEGTGDAKSQWTGKL